MRICLGVVNPAVLRPIPALRRPEYLATRSTSPPARTRRTRLAREGILQLLPEHFRRLRVPVGDRPHEGLVGRVRGVRILLPPTRPRRRPRLRGRNGTAAFAECRVGGVTAWGAGEGPAAPVRAVLSAVNRAVR
ncbi:hypothetical protein [Streptomyces sp. NPDC048419]|uniref:hypothetical protein n=1 Tax=Streptomyces sp. NPDC048419 TaxID=3365547 RepID=UPI00371EF28C